MTSIKVELVLIDAVFFQFFMSNELPPKQTVVNMFTHVNMSLIKLYIQGMRQDVYVHVYERERL